MYCNVEQPKILPTHSLLVTYNFSTCRECGKHGVLTLSSRQQLWTWSRGALWANCRLDKTTVYKCGGFSATAHLFHQLAKFKIAENAFRGELTLSRKLNIREGASEAGW